MPRAAAAGARSAGGKPSSSAGSLVSRTKSEWIKGRPEHPSLGSDPILRLLAADLVGEAPARESLLRMREDIADLRSRLADADEAAGTLPRREKYLRLNHRLAGRVLDAYEAWLDEIERELIR